MVKKKTTRLNLIIFFLFAFGLNTYSQSGHITNDEGFDIQRHFILNSEFPFQLSPLLKN